jgi:hypothetical protein
MGRDQHLLCGSGQILPSLLKGYVEEMVLCAEGTEASEGT